MVPLRYPGAKIGRGYVYRNQEGNREGEHEMGSRDALQKAADVVDMQGCWTWWNATRPWVEWQALRPVRLTARPGTATSLDEGKFGLSIGSACSSIGGQQTLTMSFSDDEYARSELELTLVSSAPLSDAVHAIQQ